MKILLDYINGLSRDEQEQFAKACETSISYLRKACSTKQPLGEKLCIDIDRESGGKVPVDQMRPDCDWEYIRASRKTESPEITV